MNTRALLFESVDRIVGGVWSGRVLEVAVGAGTTTRYLLDVLDARGSYLGVDVDPECVRQLRAWCETEGVVNVEFRVLDATRGLPEAEVDLVVSDTTINVMGPAYGAFLALAYEALSPGGRLLLRELAAPLADEPYDDFMRRVCAASVLRGGRYVCVSREDAERVLGAIGFGVVESLEANTPDFPLRFEEWEPFGPLQGDLLRDDVERFGLRSYVVEAVKP